MCESEKLDFARLGRGELDTLVEYNILSDLTNVESDKIGQRFALLLGRDNLEITGTLFDMDMAAVIDF